MGKKEIEEFPKTFCSEIGSFAYESLINRVPGIIDRVVTDNQYSPSVNSRMMELSKEARGGLISPFEVSNGEQADWDRSVDAYAGKTWFDTDFYFMEAYMYRRIVEITGFFNDMNDHRYDPFHKRKAEDLESQSDLVAQYCNWFYQLDETQNCLDEPLKELLLFSLWGNKSDLCFLTSPRDNHGASEEGKFQDAHLLIDHRSQIIEKLNGQLNTIDIVLDNAGIELFTDLLMSMVFLDYGVCKEVRLHTKLHPTFVSDTINLDIYFMMGFLKNSRVEICRKFGRHLEARMKDGSIIITAHAFWNSPWHFYDMPEDLVGFLNRGDLMILKGDANYRRLLGDRHVPLTTPTEALVDYLPAPAVTLRTLKSEVLSGMQRKKISRLDNLESDWRYSGKYGTIQFL